MLLFIGIQLFLYDFASFLSLLTCRFDSVDTDNKMGREWYDMQLRSSGYCSFMGWDI